MIEKTITSPDGQNSMKIVYNDGSITWTPYLGSSAARCGKEDFIEFKDSTGVMHRITANDGDTLLTNSPGCRWIYLWGKWFYV